MKSYVVASISIPYGLDIPEVIAMFNKNGIFVDDMCAVSKDGREVNLWIPKEDVSESNLNERSGSFWGAQPEEGL